MLKCKVRKISIEFFKELTQRSKSKMTNLEDRLSLLESKMNFYRSSSKYWVKTDKTKLARMVWRRSYTKNKCPR